MQGTIHKSITIRKFWKNSWMRWNEFEMNGICRKLGAHTNFFDWNVKRPISVTSQKIYFACAQYDIAKKTTRSNIKLLNPPSIRLRSAYLGTLNEARVLACRGKTMDSLTARQGPPGRMHHSLMGLWSEWKSLRLSPSSLSLLSCLRRDEDPIYQITLLIILHMWRDIKARQNRAELRFYWNRIT